MKALELLAPARTADIGIAAIDCGADAVYIAGPAFGARQAAGNSVEDIARLCEYAHRYGVHIYATVNTLLEPEEIPEARELVKALEKAGVDALIVQDPAVLGMSDSLIMHASTQCALRTPEKAKGLESLGFGRLVLERELSLEQIKAISQAVHTEIEFFVHGALCVCYSGQCYLSEYLTGRSANRGACAQPCRSLYDLEDASGKVLVRNKVKAYVGGPDYRYFKYDNVRQGKRQVGSTIKPFLYTQAMESGMTPCDPVLNSPVVIATGNEEETWSPQDPHADGTMVDLTWGLAHSSNSVSAYLMKQLGAPSMVSMMRKMGIGGFVDPVVSLCVGSADLSVYDMVTAYNTSMSLPSSRCFPSPTP